MRKKREIAELEAKAQELAFPKDNPEVSRFFRALQDVLYENCEYAISKTLEYDCFDQKYYVTIKHGGQLFPMRECNDDVPADNACVTLERGCTIDPKQPLVPQIEAINKTKASLIERFNQIAVMMDLFKDGYQMRK